MSNAFWPTCKRAGEISGKRDKALLKRRKALHADVMLALSFAALFRCG
jgi:hypothetical protein